MDPVANAQLRAAAAEAVAAWIALNDTGADDDAELTRTGCGPDADRLQLFRNKHFVKRDYEATNIVSCLAESAPDENWVPTTHEELNAMLRSPLQPLYIQAGVQYYGYL